MLIGAGGLSAAEFDALTPREVGWRIEAMRNQETRELKLIGQLAAWVLTPFSKSALSVRDFVQIPGEDRPGVDWGKWLKG